MQKCTVFHVKININLMQNDPEIIHFHISQQDKLQVRWCFIVVKLVDPCPIRYE